ncbi:MAG: hypothetical protein IE933_11305 [Sphingomonadales bacterium]|nr:hypothetical protein [Sphingomonadales bacterium]MBD3774874.1 hypothetical protein [Paracoccaceae bacterium]
MTDDEFARESWQASDAASALPSLEELRGRSDRFRRKIARRNLIEYLAAIPVVLGFGAYLLFLPGWPIKLGSALVIVATIFVLARLRRDGSSRALPEQAGATSVIAFQRAELERQRVLLDGIFAWYIAPFLPGMALVMAGPTLLASHAEWAEVLAASARPFALAVAVLVGVWWLNKRAARRLAGEIAELDALTA